ncbi:MAG: histidine--tRNA ligase [Acidimicrobiia bacterium]|nr:histidine--tRNA ligase [Acidimicrobiia bacterium]
MTEPKRDQLVRPKGTIDVLAPESDRWRMAHRIFEDLAERFGYGLVLTPMFEHTEVFARGVGQDTEVVEKQMYTFVDRGDRSVTLRPEATASVVRALIQSGISGRFKGAYWGPMFRYERPQKGRMRQFYQGGVEYLGSESPEADVEVIEFGYRFLEELRVPGVEVHLNSIGDPTDRAAYRAEITAFLRAHESDLSRDARKRIDTNPMRVLDSKADTEVVKAAPVPIDHLGAAAKEHFETVKAGLEVLNIPYVVDDKLVRGLDYYNRTVWEYIATQFDAAHSAVGGGGRYDGLFEILGGTPTPAVGLAMGIDRILLASDIPLDVPSLDVFVVVVDESLRSEARLLVSELRSGGIRVDMSDVQRSVKAQFKEADRRRSISAVVVGDEWNQDNVTIRDLATGEQSLIGPKEIAQWLKNR